MIEVVEVGDLSTMDGPFPSLDPGLYKRGKSLWQAFMLSGVSGSGNNSFKLLLGCLSPLNYETKINPFSH